ncbi:hypothetical protein M885DRAFT_591277 [Pelagophyceae sp. CCMP2097]|nr:hypothetical protein M885DRAFT_591277 [Pelagophyceae sp. CCMP2097]
MRTLRRRLCPFERGPWPRLCGGGPTAPEYSGGGGAMDDSAMDDDEGGEADLLEHLLRPSLRAFDAETDGARAMADVLAHGADRADFEAFAAGRGAADDVRFCLDAEDYRIKYTTRALSRETQLAEAGTIFNEYVSEGAPRRVALSYKAAADVEECLRRPPDEACDEDDDEEDLEDAEDFLAHFFSAARQEVVLRLVAAHLQDFAFAQKRRRGLAIAAQLLAGAAPLGAHLEAVHQASLRAKAAKSRAAAGLNMRKLYAAALRSKAREYGLNAAQQLAAAVSMCAAQGHDMWRQEWQLDARNLSGSDARVKHGENIDVHFSDLQSIANQAENLRAAELAVALVLRSDLPRQTQLEIVHNEWRKAENNAYAAGSHLDVPFFKLPDHEKRKQAMWLSAARQAVTEVSAHAFLDSESDEDECHEPAFHDSPEIKAVNVAILVVAAAGHRQWREAWRRDPRNAGGRQTRVKFGENIDVPFEQLQHAANRRGNLRAAEQAVVLVLREDLSEDARLHLLHEDWLAANEHARSGPLDRPYGDLSPADQAKDAFWLSSARANLCLDYVR